MLRIFCWKRVGSLTTKRKTKVIMMSDDEDSKRLLAKLVIDVGIIKNLLVRIADRDSCRGGFDE